MRAQPGSKQYALYRRLSVGEENDAKSRYLVFKCGKFVTGFVASHGELQIWKQFK